ncbi:Eco57I restriction-modification methylase domain-containing protein [Prevotella sp.]|uniref:Eco57I restriction-modification methylase domain-containing protein n=1 Tax=Prevotella sp. TaxID=59823 RepID=UPI0025F30B65|nr:N-6 DNA methylase [Prevotella sp.]
MNKILTYQAYYTKSDPILNYMTGMLDFKPHDHILEPCGGDGVFIDKILEQNIDTQISVFELNPTAVSDLKKKYSSKSSVSIKETDTLLDETILSCSKKYDKIIGNPPYGARNDEKKKDLLNKFYSDLYTKESYTLFLYACIRCLKENGELCFIVPDTFLSLHRHLSIRKFLLTNTKIKELALFPSSFFPGINFGYANLCIITLERCSNVSQNLNNGIKIRTNFKSVEELEDSKCGNSKVVSQKFVYDGVGSAFMFNSTDIIAELINNEELKKIGDIASCVTGFYSGDDKKYLHPINNEVKNSKKYVCANVENIRTTFLSPKEKESGIYEIDNLVPIVKGGNIEYVKPNHWFMDWSTQAISEYKHSKKCRFQNSDFYFKNGIGIPMIRSSKLTGALIEGRLFDQSIVGVFPHDETWIYYLLGFFNSAVCTELINAINPSTNNSANYIKKIPFIAPCEDVKRTVDILVKRIISDIKSGVPVVDTYKKELDNIFTNLYFKGIGIDSKKSKKRQPSIKQLSFLESFDQCSDNVFGESSMVHEDFL